MVRLIPSENVKSRTYGYWISFDDNNVWISNNHHHRHRKWMSITFDRLGFEPMGGTERKGCLWGLCRRRAREKIEDGETGDLVVTPKEYTGTYRTTRRLLSTHIIWNKRTRGGPRGKVYVDWLVYFLVSWDTHTRAHTQ